MQRVFGLIAGEQDCAGRQADAKRFELAAEAANRQLGFGIDAAAIDACQQSAVGFEYGWNLGRVAFGLAPGERKIAGQPQILELGAIADGIRRFEDRAGRNLADGLRPGNFQHQLGVERARRARASAGFHRPRS